MKKFEILRYLKRFSLLIFLVALAGAAAIYLYADGRQMYTASVIIRYTNDGISDGYTPDGSDLDVNEIYSSTVISQAMDALGASGRLSTIRSNISVTPVIPEDQQTINDALLDKGEEVTYFPDTYKVSLVVDGALGAGYARNMLDAIIQSYCTYYTEKYVEQKLSLNPSSDLLDNGYDYYECIRILENDTTEMQNYLLSKREHCAAAIMHRSAVDGVAVTLHRQGKYFVSGQLSHCYKLSLDARKRASRWNVCGSHGDVHSIYGSASPIIAEQNPVPSIFCVPDAPDRKVCPRSPTEVGYPAGLPVSIPRNCKKVKEKTPRKKLRMCLSHSAECDKHEYK